MMEGMRTDQKDAMTQIRLDMNRGFDQLRSEMQIQNGRVRKSEENIAENETRITTIETERRMEDKQAIRRGGWAGLIAAAGLGGVVELAKALWHR